MYTLARFYNEGSNVVVSTRPSRAFICQPSSLWIDKICHQEVKITNYRTHADALAESYHRVRERRKCMAVFCANTLHTMLRCATGNAAALDDL